MGWKGLKYYPVPAPWQGQGHLPPSNISGFRFSSKPPSLGRRGSILPCQTQPRGLVCPSWRTPWGTTVMEKWGDFQQGNVVFAPGATFLCHPRRVGTATRYRIAVKGFFWGIFLKQTEPDAVCQLSPISPPLSFSLFIRTLSRMWFLWLHFCLIRCGLYLKAAQKWVSSYLESFYLGFVFFFWQAALCDDAQWKG